MDAAALWQTIFSCVSEAETVETAVTLQHYPTLQVTQLTFTLLFCNIRRDSFLSISTMAFLSSRWFRVNLELAAEIQELSNFFPTKECLQDFSLTCRAVEVQQLYPHLGRIVWGGYHPSRWLPCHIVSVLNREHKKMQLKTNDI